MAQTFQGEVCFQLHNTLIPHRFEVSITDDNKIILWIEDRQSKKQWHTDALDTSDFATAENAIPKAKNRDYASKFATCLKATSADTRYKRALSAKGTQRVLTLTLPLQWASEDLLLEYTFTLKEVPLERIDILGARVRDVEDKVARMPIFAQATTKTPYTTNHNLVWVAGDGNADGAIKFLSTGHIQFGTAGVYAIDMGVTHVEASDSTVFELKRFDTTLLACQGYSNHGHFATTPLHYVLKAEANDKIRVVYKATGRACAGSYISIAQL